MWEQTLSGLIKALRASKDNEAAVIRQALCEMSVEVRSTEAELKAGAVLKLCYLDMLGYPQLGSYAFNVIECMSSPRTHIKLIGYLAACQSFGPATQVSMLTTNLLKKDLHARPAPVLQTTLAALPHLLTPQNSPDLAPDILAILNHSKPPIRKRAILVIHSLAKLDLERALQDDLLTPDTRHPELDRMMAVWVDRLREKLLDEDLGVVSSAVNVVCELALLYPWPWLELAAELYDLLKLGNNNWMMIKIVKLFTALTPIEPRLTRKLLPALTELISTTNAMSLLYECIHTILAGGLLTAPESQDFASTITDKLAGFLTDPDQNLRYMALVGLHKLLSYPAAAHPHLLESHLHTILCLVADPDPSLNSRALDLIEGIGYHPGTLQETIDFLLAHLYGQHPELSDDEEADEPSPAIRSLRQAAGGTKAPSPVPLDELAAHRRRVAEVLIAIGSHDTYAHITDFEWFLDILVALAPFQLGALLPDRIIDVVTRVPGLRHYALQTLSRLELTPPILRATIWICGEYGTGPEELESLLQLPSLEPQLDTLLLHNALKLLAKSLHQKLYSHDGSLTSQSMAEAIKLAERLADHAKLIGARTDVGEGIETCEMVERAREINALVSFVIEELRSAPPPPLLPLEQQHEPNVGFYEEPNPFAAPEQEKVEAEVPVWYTTLNGLFSTYELRPVAPSAQSMVVEPEELQLDSWRSYLVVEQMVVEESLAGRDEYGRLIEEVERPRKKKTKNKKLKVGGGKYRGGVQEDQVEEDEEIDVDSIPIVKLDLSEIGMEVEEIKEKKKKKKVGQGINSSGIGRRQVSGTTELVVDRVGEMPDMSYLTRKSTTAVLVPVEGAVGDEQQVVSMGSSEQQQTEGVVKVVVKKKKKKLKAQKDREGGS